MKVSVLASLVLCLILGGFSPVQAQLLFSQFGLPAGPVPGTVTGSIEMDRLRNSTILHEARNGYVIPGSMASGLYIPPTGLCLLEADSRRPGFWKTLANMAVEGAKMAPIGAVLGATNGAIYGETEDGIKIGVGTAAGYGMIAGYMKSQYPNTQIRLGPCPKLADQEIFITDGPDGTSFRMQSTATPEATHQSTTSPATSPVYQPVATSQNSFSEFTAATSENEMRRREKVVLNFEAPAGTSLWKACIYYRLSTGQIMKVGQTWGGDNCMVATPQSGIRESLETWMVPEPYRESLQTLRGSRREIETPYFATIVGVEIENNVKIYACWFDVPIRASEYGMSVGLGRAGINTKPGACPKEVTQ